MSKELGNGGALFAATSFSSSYIFITSCNFTFLCESLMFVFPFLFCVPQGQGQCLLKLLLKPQCLVHVSYPVNIFE